MKRILSVITFTILLFVTASATTNTWCVLHLADGSKQAYLIPGRMNVIPTTTELTLTSSCLETTYDLTKVLSYSFMDDNFEDAIRETIIPQKNITFVTPDEVKISGIDATMPIHLFSTNGTEYPLNSQRDGSSITISLRGLATGIYLITLPGTNKPAIKIIRK